MTLLNLCRRNLLFKLIPGHDTRFESSETPHAEREASGGPLEGGSRDKGFSEVIGGRASSFLRTLRVTQSPPLRGGSPES